LQWYTDRRGVIIGYGYDSLGRRVFAGFGHDGSSYDSTINYTFDPGNRLTDSLDSLSGAIHRTFDGRYRLIYITGLGLPIRPARRFRNNWSRPP
jgi:hypothetical protein